MWIQKESKCNQLIPSFKVEIKMHSQWCFHTQTEMTHEKRDLSFIWLLILQMHMRSHPAGPDLGLCLKLSLVPCIVSEQRWFWWDCEDVQACLSLQSFHNMSRDMTKPIKWVCAQQRLRSAWASASLIRGCPGWSESLLGAHATLLVLSWGGSFVYPSRKYYHYKPIDSSSVYYIGSQYNFSFSEICRQTTNNSFPSNFSLISFVFSSIFHTWYNSLFFRKHRFPIQYGAGIKSDWFQVHVKVLG